MEPNDLAELEYHGTSGSTYDCQDAIIRLIQAGVTLVRAKILTHKTSHGFFLYDEHDCIISIKPGFASGYTGTGPTGLSYVIELLRRHDVELDEIMITEAQMHRLEASGLTAADVDEINSARPVRPRRLWDYIRKMHHEASDKQTLWASHFPQELPLAIIDPRLIDLALQFKENPDHCLLQAYKRLEDIVRNRTSSPEHNSKLFSSAFHKENGTLTWTAIDPGEHTGRINLFTGAYMAHRNPLAHREKGSEAGHQISQFLLINHLYELEALATQKSSDSDPDRDVDGTEANGS